MAKENKHHIAIEHFQKDSVGVGPPTLTWLEEIEHKASQENFQVWPEETFK